MYMVVVAAIIIFSVLAVTSRKILRSATYLLFTLFATAAIYFQLGYEFLGAVQIAVYAGGIVVLFVFSILLTSKPGDKSEKLTSKKKVVGLIASVAMLLVAGYALLSRCGFFAQLPAMEGVTMDRIGTELLSSSHGGMLLPFAYGILFANEALSFAKVLSILLICTAVGCSFEKGAGGKNAYRFYAAIFVLNGLVGVLSKIHLSVPALAVDSYSFMATIQLALLAMCLLYCFITRQGIPKQSGKLYLCLSGYAVCNGIGNLFCQIALTSLPASVQYPIITGGVMVFSTLISLVRREPIGGKTYFAAALACLSTILILF